MEEESKLPHLADLKQSAWK